VPYPGLSLKQGLIRIHNMTVANCVYLSSWAGFPPSLMQWNASGAVQVLCEANFCCRAQGSRNQCSFTNSPPAQGGRVAVTSVKKPKQSHSDPSWFISIQLKICWCWLGPTQYVSSCARQLPQGSMIGYGRGWTGRGMG
jgi:hypothetical protein